MNSHKTLYPLRESAYIRHVVLIFNYSECSDKGACARHHL